MKLRRYVLTIEVVTWRTLADLRRTNEILFCNSVLARSESNESRIVQVQVNAIQPEPRSLRDFDKMRDLQKIRSVKFTKAAFAERSAYRARLAKFAKEDARLAAADRLRADIDKAWQAHQRKAKRAKGAK